MDLNTIHSPPRFTTEQSPKQTPSEGHTSECTMCASHGREEQLERKDMQVAWRHHIRRSFRHPRRPRIHQTWICSMPTNRETNLVVFSCKLGERWHDQAKVSTDHSAKGDEIPRGTNLGLISQKSLWRSTYFPGLRSRSFSRTAATGDRSVGSDHDAHNISWRHLQCPHPLEAHGRGLKRLGN